MTFDPMSVEVACVTLPKDHCVQVPWQYINVCGYSDQFCKLPHTYTYILHTHTTYSMSDHIVSYWTQFRRDNKKGLYSVYDLKMEVMTIMRFFTIILHACRFISLSCVQWGFRASYSKIGIENIANLNLYKTVGATITEKKRVGMI